MIISHSAVFCENKKQNPTKLNNSAIVNSLFLKPNSFILYFGFYFMLCLIFTFISVFGYYPNDVTLQNYE